MEEEQNLEKMVFKYYYTNLSDKQKETIRNAILSESGMSYTTFYYKLRNDSFKPLELKLIKNIIATMGISLSLLTNESNEELITDEKFEQLKGSVYDDRYK